MIDDLHDRLDAVEDKLATNDEGSESVDPVLLVRLEARYGGSREKVREIAAEHGVPPEDLLEEYEQRVNP